MRSPTQRDLTRADLDAHLRAALGADAALRDAAELGGGGFAAVWRLRLTDGRDVVLKVGPPPGTPLLRYEAGLAAAESDYYRRVRAGAPDVPVPDVLAAGDDWVLVSHLPGRPLTDLSGDAADAVRHQLGAALARLHTVTGPRYGYPAPRTGAATWPAAFAAIIDDLLADAVTWGVELPVPATLIQDTVARHARLLAVVDRPALLHVDLWDGNVLAEGDRLTGLVDGERHLYGDPLLDLVSPALFRRIEEEPAHPLLRGYAEAAGRPLPLDRRRLALYRAHLYLLMLVEMPSRGMTADRGRRDLLQGMLSAELTALSEP
jgi:aminoglycoside phosphotransferase (APT) family kinase protein